MEKIEEFERATICREENGGITVEFPAGEWSEEQWKAVIKRAQELSEEGSELKLRGQKP